MTTFEVSDDEEHAVEKLLDEKQKNDNQNLENGKFEEFEELEMSSKLQKLENLVKQSQIYSSIIAENLIQTSKSKQKENALPKQKEGPPKKKSKPNQEPTHESFKQPKYLSGATMKDYQLEGTEWLASLYQNGLNGILADEMGLGKTIQSIALLAYLYENGIEGPFLVTCPLSTVGNWVKEFEKFAPNIPVLKYLGAKDERVHIRQKYFSKKGLRKEIIVVITSYETILKDFQYLNKIEWKFLIVDEGHRLKNINCKLIVSLKQLRTSNRLLLTGTPLQNNLNELWSLLNFILPDIFHDLELFQKWFDFSSITSLKDKNDEQTNALIDAKVQSAIVNNLHQILKPFLLRRLKKFVIKNLPPKREFIIYSKLSDKQAELYKMALDKNLKKAVLNFALTEHVENSRLSFTKKEIERFLSAYLDPKNGITNLPEHDEDQLFLRSDSVSAKQHKLKSRSTRERKLAKEWESIEGFINTSHLRNLMMQLRSICNSPYLFFFPWDSEKDIDLDKLIQASSKLQMLDQLLPKLISRRNGGHKVLIFSQFTKMLDLIQDYCEVKNYDVSRLDGNVTQEEREIEIEKFKKNKDESKDVKIFLLSTRAGGLGLNLTAADSVIIFDSDWNPQVDLQAMDRVHRIGQDKPVIIYRFIVLNTVEQVLLAKADSKRILEKLVIQLGQFESLKNFMSSDVIDPNKSGLTEGLKDLFEDDRFKLIGHEQANDNTLTEKELDELTDRSDEAYQRDAEYYQRFQHIQIFETSVSLD